MLSIAIAEDNSIERRELVLQINKLGYKIVLTAVDGYDLLLQLSKLPAQKLPQILLLDIKMSKVNGLIVTIYCAYKYPSIKIIAVSSHTNDTLIAEILTEGASAFITKYFLKPDSVVYSNVYGKKNVLKSALEAVQKGELFIDKLLVNNPNEIKTTVATSAIVNKYYSHFRPKKREFAILNVADLSLSEIAELMHTTESTLKEYSTLLCKQFDVSNRYQVANACFTHGIMKLAAYYDNTMDN